MKERNIVESKGRDGGTDRRTGRLCEDSRTKDKDRNGHQRQREVNGLKGRAPDGRGRAGTKVSSRGGGGEGAGGGSVRTNNKLLNQEVYLPAMVVPRTPVAPRTQEQNQNQGQDTASAGTS